jgi:ribosome-binding factor A
LVVTPRRPGRVADKIKQTLAELLRDGVRDPRVGFVTLTDVELSTDLRHARVYVSFLGDDPEGALRALRNAGPWLRRSLASRVSLRHTPELRFEIDPSIDGGFRVDRILEDLERDRPPRPDGDEGDS